MTTELDILKLVCKRLEEAKIPYMLTGSFAGNFYAVPRMTRDLDIVIELQESHVDLLLELFQNDFYVSKSAIDQAIKFEQMFNIIHNNSVFKIDLIVRKSSLYRIEEFQRKTQVLLDNVLVWIVTPEDLIISKLYWAKDSLSEMQLKDIHNLLGTVKNLDEKYIHCWVERLELSDFYERVKGDAGYNV